MDKNNFSAHLNFKKQQNQDFAQRPLNKLFSPEKIQQELTKTGTTTVGLICKDGVCMATDNRGSAGSVVASKTAQKLHQIADYMYLTIAGGVADAQYLIDVLRAEVKLYTMRRQHKMGVKQTAKLMQNILYGNKGYFAVGLLLGGWTAREGSVLVNLGGYGSMLPDNYCVTGSGGPFALGVLETEWHPELTVEEGMILCAKAVRTSIIRDIASGNGIDVVGIKDGQPLLKSYTIRDEELKNL